MRDGIPVEDRFMSVGGAQLQSRELGLFLAHFAEQEAYFAKEYFINLCEDTSEDTVIKILAHFNENLKDGLSKLQQSVEGHDCETIWKTAHKIAGSAELLGFKKYADQSREISRQVRANPVLEAHHSTVGSYIKDTAHLHLEINKIFPSLSSFL